MITQLFPLLFLLLTTSTDQEANPISDFIDKDIEYLSEFYKQRHINAEISLEEKETSKALAAEMRKVGYQVTEGVGGYGIVAVMKLSLIHI